MFFKNAQFIRRRRITWSECRRYYSDFRSHHQVFTECLKLRPEAVQQYIKKNRLTERDPQLIGNNIEYCQRLGFKHHDLIKNPALLRIHPITLEQHHLVLEEGGFVNLTARLLVKFRTYHKKAVGTLKSSKLIREETDVARSFISYLDPRPDGFYVENDGNSEAWASIHLKTLREYLKWRLQASDDTITNVFRIYPSIKRKSFRLLCENIAMAEDLGFTPEKIVKYGYLLHSFPKYTKETLERFSNLAGGDMKKAMRRYPKLVTTSPANIEKIYKLLKEHNIPDEMIMKSLNVLHLSPETVDSRIKELLSASDLRINLHNPVFLKLVVHYNRAKKRLQLLEQSQLKCSGVALLGGDREEWFETHMKDAEDKNTFSDIHAFLRHTFKKTTKKEFKHLTEHPHYLKVPLVVMQESFNYLLELQFKPSEIYDVIWIILYSRETLSQAFQEVEIFKETRDGELSPKGVLDMMLYFAERDHHFTGDGVWLKSEGEVVSVKA